MSWFLYIHKWIYSTIIASGLMQNLASPQNTSAPNLIPGWKNTGFQNSPQVISFGVCLTE